MMKFLALAVFSAFVVACCGATKLTFKADYKMKFSTSYPNGYMTGKLYYYYTDEGEGGVMKSRMCFETNYRNLLGENLVHKELFHYENGAHYSICSSCEATVLADPPELWVEQGLDECTDEGGYRRCNRQSSFVSTYGVVEFVAKGTPGNGYDVKYVKFADGRELELNNVEMISYAQYVSKFELSDDSECPKPVCRSFIDVVFVLDASDSVDPTEWNAQKRFLKNAAGKFQVDEFNAHIGIAEFASPYQTCRWKYPEGKPVTSWPGWKDVVCNDEKLGLKKVTGLKDKNGKSIERYLDDCVWDTRCNNVTDTTATIFLNLTHRNVEDTINTLSRIKGHTCQRYGLRKAYEMMFENNPRCPGNPENRSACPIPVVIVVTDGEDLCHAGTLEWAEKIKNKDPRGILLEVGVGLNADYDEEFLANLSSKINGQAASLNVNDYASIETILDKLMAPACSMGQLSGGSVCGTSCKGYCACGECFCPQCSEDAPNCKNYQCSTASPEGGCKVKNVTCSLSSDLDPQCNLAYCSEVDGECKTDPVDCKQIKETELGRELKECEIVSCNGGCTVKRNDTYCQMLVVERALGKCMVGSCDPTFDPDDPSGCKFVPKICNIGDFPGCKNATCNERNGECNGHDCAGNCFWSVEDPETGDDIITPKCPPKPCKIVTCNEEATSDDYNVRCNEEDFVCEPSGNKCMVRYCAVDAQGNNYCEEDFNDTLNCKGKNVPGGCRTWKCDPDADDGKGACVAVEQEHEHDNCIDYICGDYDIWEENPRCQSTKACTVARCDDSDGSCLEVEVSCRGKVKLPNKCFEAACREPDGCYKKQFRGAYFDVCGNCISDMPDDTSMSYESSNTEECEMTSEEDLPTEGLAAAAIALIVIGAIIIGAAVALSSVVGTKALIDRARGAANQSVVSNPLFEESQTEMTNPGFMGDA